MLPYKTLISINRNVDTAVYLQIAKCIIQEISNGRISPNTQLPSSRKLSEILEVHRKTIVAAYDELEAQGWVYKKANIGTFVIQNIPDIVPIQYESTPKESKEYSFLNVNYDFSDIGNYSPSRDIYNAKYRLDDGFPDSRLAPLSALSKEYSSLLKNSRMIKSMNYFMEHKGDQFFRQELVNHLKETRGIQTTVDNILVTRGSLMAFYLLFSMTIQKGDNVAVAEPGYNALNKLVSMHHGTLRNIQVDENGLIVEDLESVLQKETIKYLFIIPHHHHPTTVKLSPERRIKLLQLSEKYNFAIIEDDYDFDFHYSSSPVLPLASMNHQGNLIYVGSFSKLIAPALRLGFIVGKRELIDNLAHLRRYIDWKGDPILERAVSHLIKSGEIRRYLNKALIHYRKRRDVLCDLLQADLSDLISFQPPEGGLAIWTQFDPSIDLYDLRQKCLAKSLYITTPHIHFSEKTHHHGVRLGFASMNEEELVKAFNIFKKVIRE